jgi:hypothetical protein
LIHSRISAVAGFARPAFDAIDLAMLAAKVTR